MLIRAVPASPATSKALSSNAGGPETLGMFDRP